jgi:hypothetical protein
MLVLVLLCGVYLFGMLIARGVTLPRQALVSGGATCTAACVATVTLWLLTRTEMIEAWLAVAMIGTITLPALMLGLGLLAGGWMRITATGHLRWHRLSILCAAAPLIAAMAIGIAALVG